MPPTATEASASLSNPGYRGSSTFKRRSAMVLNSIFGWSSSQNEQNEQTEREPLLNDQAVSSQSIGYGSANQQGESSATGAQRRFIVPKPPKVKTPVRVEAKVWLANERTWISWLHLSMLVGSFALALYNSASFFSHHHPDLPEDPTKPRHPKRNQALRPDTIRTFGLIYAGIAALTLAWGLGNYLRRVHLIKTKYSGSFDDLIGPPLICTALFIAVLLNFIVRVQEHNLELP